MTPLYFFGSDHYSAIVLQELVHRNQELKVIVITEPNSYLATYASSYSLPIVPYSSPLLPQSHSVGLSASFPYLFPPDLIHAFGGRLYNLHPSLLPQYRNVAPVPYAIAMGDTQTGITLQRIDELIDHGEIIAQINVPILPTDTTPMLLDRLFTMGAEIFLDHLSHRLTGTLEHRITNKLIFTHKLTSESGHLEWPVVLKLINGETIAVADTANPLINLRLTHHPDRTTHILSDLIRALTGYEKVWTVAPTKKGDLRISLVLAEIRNSKFEIRVLVPGKPRPISWSDFTKYYL